MIHFKGVEIVEAVGPHPLTVECPIPDYATYRDNDLVLVMFAVDSPYWPDTLTYRGWPSVNCVYSHSESVYGPFGTRWIEAHTEIVGGKEMVYAAALAYVGYVERPLAVGRTDPISITVDVKGWNYYVKAPRDIGVRAYVSVWADAYTDVYLASALAWAYQSTWADDPDWSARSLADVQPVNPAITQTGHTLIHWAFGTGTLEWSHSRPTSSRRLNDQAPGISVACFDEVLTVDGQGNGGEVSTGGAPTRGLVWTWYVLPRPHNVVQVVRDRLGGRRYHIATAGRTVWEQYGYPPYPPPGTPLKRNTNALYFFASDDTEDPALTPGLLGERDVMVAPAPVEGAGLALRADGVLTVAYVQWRTAWIRRSYDCGETWGAPVLVAEGYDDLAGPVYDPLSGLLALALFRAEVPGTLNGTWYIVCGREEPAGSMSWSTPRAITGQNARRGRASLSVRPDGVWEFAYVAWQTTALAQQTYTMIQRCQNLQPDGSGDWGWWI